MNAGHPLLLCTLCTTLALLGLGGVAPARADTDTRNPPPGYGFITILREVPPQPVLRHQPPGEAHGTYAAPDVAALPALEELSDGEAGIVSAYVTGGTGAAGDAGAITQHAAGAATQGTRDPNTGALGPGLDQALGGVAGHGAGIGHSVSQATQGLGAAVTGATASLGQIP